MLKKLIAPVAAFLVAGTVLAFAANLAVDGNLTVGGTISANGGSGAGSSLPDAQYSTAALQATTFAAGQLTGAKYTAFDNTGTTPGTMTTRTATQMFADLPGAVVGQSYVLAIRNSSGSANTLTLAAGTGVTLTGTMTVAQTVTRTFIVTFTSATAVTIQSMGISAAGA